MAHLEFLYVSALDHTEHGIPNLERQICQSPSLFAQAVALTYKRIARHFTFVTTNGTRQKLNKLLVVCGDREINLLRYVLYSL